MRVKKDFILRTVAGQNMVVAVGETSRTFNGMIRLNEVGAFLWRQMENADQTVESLTDALLSEYAVERPVAEADVRKFVDSLQGVDVFE